MERGEGWFRIGPLVITTWRRYKAHERNAFEIGREIERIELGLPPRPVPPREKGRLRAV